MKTASERIRELEVGQVIYTDYDDTLFYHDTETPNYMLITELKTAKARGVKVMMWTHANFNETIHRVENMKNYGLEFDAVYCNVPKGDLIIDNLAVTPRHEKVD